MNNLINKLIKAHSNHFFMFINYVVFSVIFLLLQYYHIMKAIVILKSIFEANFDFENIHNFQQYEILINFFASNIKMFTIYFEIFQHFAPNDKQRNL